MIGPKIKGDFNIAVQYFKVSNMSLSHSKPANEVLGGPLYHSHVEIQQSVNNYINAQFLMV